MSWSIAQKLISTGVHLYSRFDCERKCSVRNQRHQRMGRKQEGEKTHYFLKQEVVKGKGLPISWLCELGQIEAPPQLTNGKFLLEGEIIWTNSDSGWIESIQMQAASDDKNLAVFQCLPSEVITQRGSNIRAGMLWPTALFTKWMFYVILRNLPEEKQKQKQNQPSKQTRSDFP